MFYRRPNPILLILILLLGVVYPLSAQDSLRSLLKEKVISSVKDTAKANAYLAIADSYKYQNQDSTEFYIEQSLRYMSVNTHPSGMANASKLKARILFVRGNYRESIEEAEKGLSVIIDSEKYQNIEADLLRIIGINYGSIGNYELSLKNFLESQKIYEEIENLEGRQAILNNIGVIRIKMENYEEALLIFSQLDELVDPKEPINVTIPVNLGFIYYELGELDKAKEQLKRALSMKGDIDRRAYGLSNFKLGQIFSDENNFQGAIESFNASIDIYTDFQNELEKVQSLTGIAEVYLKLDNLDEARNYASEALTISERRNALPEKKASLESLFKIEKQDGNFEKALEYHESFKNISDSLQNAEINEEIGRLSAEYIFEQREQQLLLEKQKADLDNQAKIQRQKVFISASVIVLIFAALVIIFIFRSYRLKKESNRELAEKNRKIKRQSDKLKQSNKIRERLFSIIAHDLRGPLSSLHALVTLMEMNKSSKEELDNLIPDVAKRFKYTSTLLNNLLQWSQSQFDGYKVLPETFDMIKLYENKRDLLSEKLKEKNLNLVIPDGEYLVFADKNMIELVVQNLISNAIKYTDQNGKIILSISDQDGRALIAIEDNGVGIPPDKVGELFKEKFYTTKGTDGEKGTGLGLMLCKDFVEKNGGILWVKSEVGKGSTFYFTLPHPD